MFTVMPGAAQLADNPIDFRFRYLEQVGGASQQPGRMLPSTIRFRTRPTEDVLASIEAMGVKFLGEGGRRLGTTTVYPVELSPGHLPKLAAINEIATVEPAWRPFHVPPLDVSRPQVQADSVWKLTDKSGGHITGKGILIADLDTGVDLFHPMLFFADGDTLNWIDVNANGSFDPGIDAVDLNRNGIADPGELLGYVELPYAGNVPGVYDVDTDFLYNDANSNGIRDKGTSSGFTESSPTYGEQWFITLDGNGDNRLSVGEQLVGLKTSKIRAIREIDGTVRRRGVDLILANTDTGPYGGHGTSVTGIAIGGVPGIHKVAGIAPGAEMVVASLDFNSTPPFVTTFPVLMAWMQAEGARVMLYEDGEWVWDYLDGSSNVEIMINELANAGIVQVTPAGNLTGGGMQKTVVVTAEDSIDAIFTGGSSSTVWPSIRWRGAVGDVLVRLQVDASDMVTLPADGSTITVGGKQVYSDKSLSSRGTAMMIAAISGSSSSTYTVRLVNTSGSALRVDGMLGDNAISWSGLATWAPPSDDNTVTWPATADSGIVAAAYKNKAATTDINSFSGRGTRIDGVPLVDVAAPGSTVYSIARNVRYTAFGGTSAAGPHVAGASALLLQTDTTLTHARVKQLLCAGAFADTYTGTVPNTTWGYGKLRIANAITPLLTSAEAYAVQPTGWRLEQNFPNPFNPTTVVRYQVPVVSDVKLAVYDVLGREVSVLVNERKASGSYTVTFNASGLATGIYFYRLQARQLDGGQAGSLVETKRLLLLR
jgi:hypothetical protein